jgi:CelD/BcsL family acetyltransferase involved in cellulose biosynthesis
MITVERIPGSEAFGRMGEEWDRLLEASGSANIHLIHAWLSTWAATLGRGRDLLVLRILEDGDLIGFVPLMIETIRLQRLVPYKRILFLGDPHSDFGDFVIVRSRTEAVKAVFECLRRTPGWGEILLNAIPETSPNLKAFRAGAAGFGGSGLVAHSRCYFIRIAGRTWDDFFAGTSKGAVRKDARRLKNHYAKLDWAFQEWDGTDLPTALADAARLHAMSQTRKGRESIYGGEAFRGFLRAMIEALGEKGRVRVFFLKIGGQAVSFMLGFEYRRVFSWWNTGFDPAFKNLSPTKFLLLRVLEEAFAKDCWDEFNFMRGGSAYKADWTPSFFPLFQLRVRNPRGLAGLVNKLRRLPPAPPA